MAVDALYLLDLFPACAGVIPRDGGEKAQAIPFPRMRGGDPAYIGKLMDGAVFSPHARG